MAKKKTGYIGECQICGKEEMLTYEHIPNEASYNKKTVIEYSFDDVFVKKTLGKGSINQRGSGAYTLCRKCNNDTGSWYADEYTKWAKTSFDFLQNNTSSTQRDAQITIHNVYPLRFLKQVVVCFFSITPGLSQTHPKLIEFVLNKEEKDFPQDIRLFLKFYFGTNPFLRRSPIGAKLTLKQHEGQFFITSNIISEMAHPPFQLVMSDKAGFDDNTGEITSFSNYDYGQHVKEITLISRVLIK